VIGQTAASRLEIETVLDLVSWRFREAGQEGVLQCSRNPFLVNVNFLVFDWPTRNTF